jgi:myo-inositol 2-dehydrogenase/D-chiro-inositol 1-dehydrogenase
VVEVSFAGAGWIAQVHALALGTLQGVTIGRVASRSRERARASATEMGVTYTTYDALPGGADVIIVATNPGTHAREALRAAAGGAAAIIEKPLCATLDDADAIVAAEVAGARYCYAENLLFAPVVSAANTEIAQIGSLSHLSARALQARPTWGSFLNRSWGGGVLFDLGVHPLALVMRAARSAVVSVTATLEGADDIEVDEWAQVQLGFESGATATVEASWRATTPVWDLQAASGDGVVRLDLLPDISLERNGEPVLVSGPDATEYPPQLDVFGYRDQLIEALAEFRAGRSASVSDAAFGRDVLDVVHAAYASAGLGGTPVPVPFGGRRDVDPIVHWRPEA